MSWYDSFKEGYENLFKKKVEDTSFNAMFQRVDVEKFFNALNNLWHPDELIRKIGGYNKLQLLYKDADIYAAIDKRIAALLDTRLVIDGTDPVLVKFFQEQILPHERQLKQDFWWTVYNGWGVEQIIYNEDGSGRVSGFQKEDFWRFEPQRDLIHIKLINTTDNLLRNKIVPYGKWVLTTNNGSSSNPIGDAMASRLITPWIMKCNTWDLWMDFAKRFANGYVHAKISDEKEKDKVRKALESAAKSTILVTDKNSEFTMIQPNRDSSLYSILDERTVKSIQKVILGETQSSDMQERGSAGSAGVHNEVRLEKTRADIDLVTTAINEVIYQIALVNEFDTTNLPKASLIYDPAFNLDLASRDQTLHGMGVRFNKDYYKNNYGLKDKEFEVVDTDAISTPSFGFGSRGKKTFLSPEEMKKFIGGVVKPCNHGLKLDAETSRKASRQQNENDEIVAVLNRTAAPPLDSDDLISAILTSKNEKELDEKLNLLFDVRNNKFVDDMTNALYYAAARGAMFGNPETVPNEEE